MGKETRLIWLFKDRLPKRSKVALFESRSFPKTFRKSLLFGYLRLPLCFSIQLKRVRCSNLKIASQPELLRGELLRCRGGSKGIAACFNVVLLNSKNIQSAANLICWKSVRRLLACICPRRCIRSRTGQDPDPGRGPRFSEQIRTSSARIFSDFN